MLVHHTLQNFISHAQIRDIDATTRRLVDRCLSGDWCRHIPPPNNTMPILDQPSDEPEEIRASLERPRVVSDATALIHSNGNTTIASTGSSPGASNLARRRSLARSASAEILRRTENGNPNTIIIHNHADSRDANGKGGISVTPGPSPFSPLSRMPSVKARKGQGLTAHMATTLGMPSGGGGYGNDSTASLVNGADVAVDGLLSVKKHRHGKGYVHDSTTPLSPRSESGMISPLPSPRPTLSPSPPPSTTSSDGGGSTTHGTQHHSKGSAHPVTHVQSVDAVALSPAHERLAKPIRSRSLEPSSPISEAGGFSFTVHEHQSPSHPPQPSTANVQITPPTPYYGAPTPVYPTSFSTSAIQLGAPNGNSKPRSASNPPTPAPLQTNGSPRPSSSGSGTGKRPPPPPPPKRRKPPAPPVPVVGVSVQNGHGAETLHTIARSPPSSASFSNQSRSRSPSVASSTTSVGLPALPPSRSISPTSSGTGGGMSPSVSPSLSSSFPVGPTAPAKSSPLNPMTLARLRALKPKRST